MLAALDAETKRWELLELDRLIVGGAAVPRSMFEGFDRHGLTVVQAWGMTETAPLERSAKLLDPLIKPLPADNPFIR